MIFGQVPARPSIFPFFSRLCGVLFQGSGIRCVEIEIVHMRNLPKFFVMGLACLAGAGCAQPQPHTLPEQAEDLLARQEYSKVEALCNAELDKDPNSSTWLIIRGRVNVLRDPPSFDAATADFQQAVENDPTAFEAYYQLHRICLASKQFAEAARYRELADRYDPNNRYYEASDPGVPKGSAPSIAASQGSTQETPDAWGGGTKPAIGAAPNDHAGTDHDGRSTIDTNPLTSGKRIGVSPKTASHPNATKPSHPRAGSGASRQTHGSLPQSGPTSREILPGGAAPDAETGKLALPKLPTPRQATARQAASPQRGTLKHQVARPLGQQTRGSTSIPPTTRLAPPHPPSRTGYRSRDWYILSAGVWTSGDTPSKPDREI